MRFILGLLGVGLGSTTIAIFLCAFLLGPWCLSYDISHLVPLVAHKPAYIAWYHPACLILGMVFGRIWVPIALLTWLMVLVGVIA